MGRIVAAIPTENDADGGASSYRALRTALKGQEHDERMHRGSLARVATEVLGVAPDEIEQLARRYNNFVAETMCARFDQQMGRLLRPNRPLADVYTAIFIYGILSEDVVANSDVVIRRAGDDKYSEYGLPGMREGQTNVRRDEGRHVRIAVLATHKFLAEHDGAAELLVAVSTEYLNLADRLLRQAKHSHGLIAHLRESYGPDVDSLLLLPGQHEAAGGPRLGELGLTDAVRDIRSRVQRAVEEFTDDRHRPIVGDPTYVVRTLGPTMLGSHAGCEPEHFDQPARWTHVKPTDGSRRRRAGCRPAFAYARTLPQLLSSGSRKAVRALQRDRSQPLESVATSDGASNWL